jgi:hypothetical protein
MIGWKVMQIENENQVLHIEGKQTTCPEQPGKRFEPVICQTLYNPEKFRGKLLPDKEVQNTFLPAGR